MMYILDSLKVHGTFHSFKEVQLRVGFFWKHYVLALRSDRTRFKEPGLLVVLQQQGFIVMLTVINYTT